VREARAAEHHRKFSYLPIREKLVMTSAYSVRPYTLWAEGMESGVCPLGEEYDVFSWREIVRCICGTLV